MSQDNPRLQCEKCGRWYRLYQPNGMQWLYAFEGWLHGYPEVDYGSLCVPCHLDFGQVLPPYQEVQA